MGLGSGGGDTSDIMGYIKDSCVALWDSVCMCDCKSWPAA